MIRNIFVLVCLVASLFFGHTYGHGGLLEPPMRSLAWRYGFDAPINYDWMSLYCGGFHKFQQSGGKCGLCGDPYDGPFENDRGGIYDNGIIVRHYPAGMGEIEVKTEITAHHKGYITFKLCPNNENALTQDCLDRFPLVIREAQQQGDPYKFYPPKEPKLHELHVQLPQGVICDRCVLQWKYTAGNSVGKSEDGSRCLGCGLQETFINCADISIGGTVDSIPVSKDRVPPSPVEEIVLPQDPNLSSIIDNASPNSFRDVLTAIGVNTNAHAQQNFPSANEDSTTFGTQVTQRRPQFGTAADRSGDLPGLTREQVMDNSRGKGMTILQQNSERIRAMSNLVGSDIFGNRMQTRDVQQPMLNDHRSGGHNVGMPSHNSIMQNQMDRNIPPPSVMSGSITNNQFRGQMPQRGVDTVRQGSSLIGSINTAVGQIHRQNSQGIGIGTPQLNNMPNTGPTGSIHRLHFRNGQLLGPVPNTAQMHQRNSNMPHQPSPQFIQQIHDLGRQLPMSPHWQRGDGMHSHRSAVRQAPHLDTRDFSTSEIQHLVPELPRNIGPRQDIAPSLDRRNLPGMIRQRENWFPNSHRMAQERRMSFQEQTMAKTEPRDRANSLPRRIVVPSMTVAQHLLRKYPQLRGRVFLSRQAHLRNKYAHAVNKYATRQRWH